jgi:hypothetical protein
MCDSTITIDVSDAKAAKKALSAAIRKQREQAKIDRANSDLAMLRAQSSGWNVLHRKLTTNEAFPKGWRRYQPGAKYARSLVFPDKDDVIDGHTKVSTRDGYASVNTYAREIVGVVTDGSGWVIVVFMRDKTYSSSLSGGYYSDESQPVSAWAVGACEGQYHLAELPGIHENDFEASTQD